MGGGRDEERRLGLVTIPSVETLSDARPPIPRPLSPLRGGEGPAHRARHTGPGTQSVRTVLAGVILVGASLIRVPLSSWASCK